MKLSDFLKTGLEEMNKKYCRICGQFPKMEGSWYCEQCHKEVLEGKLEEDEEDIDRE